MLADIAICPQLDCLGVVILNLHPACKKNFDPKGQSWTFACIECGKFFTVNVNDLRREDITTEWAKRYYPDVFDANVDK